MVTIESIRKRAYVDGWSIRRISREMGLSRQAIRKALLSSAEPRYTRKKPPCHPVMDPFREVISGWIKADGTAPPKQRHTAHRIYTRLVEEHGFAGGESTVRRYVRLLRDKRQGRSCLYLRIGGSRLRSTGSVRACRDRRGSS